MAALTINFSLEVLEDGEKNERIEPPNTQGSVGGLLGRHVVDLETIAYRALETGGITPGWWYMRNLSEAVDVAVSFGVNDDIVLKPGRFAFFWSSQVPLAKGVGATARLAYTVGEE
ncbi:MAG: hypothetical protein J5I99_08985 [Verrucomicrobia bacterium]|nr:hypothetical protein [Verrucomicrobiota bacterium]